MELEEKKVESFQDSIRKDSNYVEIMHLHSKNQYNFVSNEQIDECKMDPVDTLSLMGLKTCLGQEKAADNKIYTFKMKENKWLYTSEVRSVLDWKVISPKQIYMMISSKQGTDMVSL